MQNGNGEKHITKIGITAEIIEIRSIMTLIKDTKENLIL